MNLYCLANDTALKIGSTDSDQLKMIHINSLIQQMDIDEKACTKADA